MKSRPRLWFMPSLLSSCLFQDYINCTFHLSVKVVCSNQIKMACVDLTPKRKECRIKKLATGAEQGNLHA